MTLTDAISRVARRLNKNSNDLIVFNRIKGHINDACREKWNEYAWSFRKREYPLALTPVVQSGTVTATTGSQTVTASGTPFLSTHTDAWINFTADTTEAWYRVEAVNSSSSITIAPAYQGTTASGKAYFLTKSDYLLPSEVRDTGSLLVTFGRSDLGLYFNRSDVFPSNATGSPTSVEIFNQDPLERTYTTGTLSGTINTVTLTGVGTAWLANVSPGDSLVIGTDTNTYTVFKVDSDTQITLYNKLVNAAVTQTYTISRQYGKVMRVSPGADQQYSCFVRGLKNYHDLVNNLDTNELLCGYPAAVVESAVWREASSSPDPREDSLYQKSEMMWATAKGEDEALLPARNYNPIFNPRARRR